jgi:hypothetical protein
MQTMPRESWTDERLGEFGKRMDERFDRVDERIKAARFEAKGEFAQVGERFDKLETHLKKIDGRIEAMQQDATDRALSQNRTMVFAVLALSSAFMAGFAALVTQI